MLPFRTKIVERGERVAPRVLPHFVRMKIQADEMEMASSAYVMNKDKVEVTE
jgi:hypothetical protein